MTAATPVPSFRVELVWNREFHFVSYGSPHSTLISAKKFAMAMVDSGDGARVKKVRVINDDDKVVWSYG